MAVAEGIMEQLGGLGIVSFDGAGCPQAVVRQAAFERQLQPPVPSRHLLSRMLAFTADASYES